MWIKIRDWWRKFFGYCPKHKVYPTSRIFGCSKCFSESWERHAIGYYHKEREGRIAEMKEAIIQANKEINNV